MSHVWQLWSTSCAVSAATGPAPYALPVVQPEAALTTQISTQHMACASVCLCVVGAVQVLSYRELYGWSMDEIVAQIGTKNNCTFCGVFRYLPSVQC